MRAARPSRPKSSRSRSSRLNGALRESGAMAKANLQRVGRVVKILREPGRAHEFAAAGHSHRAGPLHLAAPATNPLALPAPPFVRPQMAPQAIEKPEFAPGNGAPLVALYSVHASQIAARIPSPACWGRWRIGRRKTPVFRRAMAPDGVWPAATHARRLARTLAANLRSDAALLSTPHPSPSATPSPLRGGEGGARRPPAGSMTCVSRPEMAPQAA